jgi:hypothetical protein
MTKLLPMYDSATTKLAVDRVLSFPPQANTPVGLLGSHWPRMSLSLLTDEQVEKLATHAVDMEAHQQRVITSSRVNVKLLRTALHGLQAEAKRREAAKKMKERQAQVRREAQAQLERDARRWTPSERPAASASPFNAPGFGAAVQAARESIHEIHENNLVPGLLLAHKEPGAGYVKHEAARVLAGGAGKWVLMNDRLEVTYDLSKRTNAAVLSILNNSFVKAKTSGKFRTAFTSPF